MLDVDVDVDVGFPCISHDFPLQILEFLRVWKL